MENMEVSTEKLDESKPEPQERESASGAEPRQQQQGTGTAEKVPEQQEKVDSALSENISAEAPLQEGTSTVNEQKVEQGEGAGKGTDGNANNDHPEPEQPVKSHNSADSTTSAVSDVKNESVQEGREGCPAPQCNEEKTEPEAEPELRQPEVTSTAGESCSNQTATAVQNENPGESRMQQVGNSSSQDSQQNSTPMTSPQNDSNQQQPQQQESTTTAAQTNSSSSSGGGGNTSRKKKPAPIDTAAPSDYRGPQALPFADALAKMLGQDTLYMDSPKVPFDVHDEPKLIVTTEKVPTEEDRQLDELRKAAHSLISAVGGSHSASAARAAAATSVPQVYYQQQPQSHESSSSSSALRYEAIKPPSMVPPTANKCTYHWAGCYAYVGPGEQDSHSKAYYEFHARQLVDVIKKQQAELRRLAASEQQLRKDNDRLKAEVELAVSASIRHSQIAAELGATSSIELPSSRRASEALGSTSSLASGHKVETPPNVGVRAVRASTAMIMPTTTTSSALLGNPTKPAKTVYYSRKQK